MLMWYQIITVYLVFLRGCRGRWGCWRGWERGRGHSPPPQAGQPLTSPMFLLLQAVPTASAVVRTGYYVQIDHDNLWSVCSWDTSKKAYRGVSSWTLWILNNIHLFRFPLMETKLLMKANSNKLKLYRTHPCCFCLIVFIFGLALYSCYWFQCSC